jgi:NTE family protein
MDGLMTQSEATWSGTSVALALSGGGSRAMAFHLGCLRALNRTGLLSHTSVISSVSGGSVLAALYCTQPGDFSDFERSARKVLAQGFVDPALRVVLTTPEGLKAIAAIIPLAIDRFAAFVVRLLMKLLRLPIKPKTGWLRESPLRRWASRTTILRRTFSSLFGGRMLPELRSDRPRLFIVACELRAKAAFYFTADRIHCWRYGSADSSQVEIAQAVAASASYPVALPALDEYMNFEKNGVTTTRRVTLTDGGVYDNLGLAPFWPDRDPSISLPAGTYGRIIACRAGYGLEISDPAAFMPSRMIAAFESVHARAQNLAMTRLFDLKRAGSIEDFLLPYLGQDDHRLAVPPPDLVTKDSASGYPTNFSAMPEEWIDRLSRRGEQLVYALLAEHWPGTIAESKSS